ncbi:diguanylate cyclase [Herbaspirillum sp. HC18]|nr:diguanylate cyclase [Herbaspirillum sp. HC18]
MAINCDCLLECVPVTAASTASTEGVDMPHLLSPMHPAAPSEQRLSAMLRQPRLFIPIVMVLVCIAWIIVQSIRDYNNIKFKAGERVGIVAYMVADRLGDIVRAGQQAASMIILARSGGTAEQWRSQGADKLRDLRSRLQETLPGIEIGLYDVGDAALLNTDPVLYNMFSSQFAHQRSQLAESDKSVLIQFVPGQNISGNFLISESYRGTSGKQLYIVQIIVPSDAPAALLRNSLFSRDATLVLADTDNRLILRAPAIGPYVSGQQLPALDKTRPGLQPGVYFVRSSFDQNTMIVAERKVILPFSGTELVLRASISWDDYKASWRNSQIISVIIGALLLLGLTVHCYDQVRAMRQHQLLKQSSMRQQYLLQQLPIAVAVIDAADGRIRFTNPVMREQFGSLAAEGEPLDNLFHKTVNWRTIGQDDDVPVRMLGRTGQAYMQVSRSELAVPDRTGSIGIVLTFLDATERYLREQQLLTDATTDALTGLANRRQFDFMAERLIAAAHAGGKPLWVLVLDLDHFKRVNDTYGHDAGDLVLQQTARLLQGAMRSGDMAARLGGEEFGALLAGVTLEQAHAMAERVRQVIAGAPVQLADGRMLTVTASIGIAMLQPDDIDIYAAVKRADKALYIAKEGGRNRVVIASGDSAMQA